MVQTEKLARHLERHQMAPERKIVTATDGVVRSLTLEEWPLVRTG